MTPSPEQLPTKAKEASSPHVVRLAPLDTNPAFQCLRIMIWQYRWQCLWCLWQWYDNVYDDSLESDRLKTINIKPWTPITYRNCVLYWMCADRYHSDNYHSCWHWMQLPSWWSWHQVPSYKKIQYTDRKLNCKCTLSHQLLTNDTIQE